MPQSPNHPPFQMILERRHGDRCRPGDTSAANEIIITGGHVGTHVDALSHFSHAGRLHGDVDAAEAQTGGRFKQHGAERSEEHTSELPSLMRISYDVFSLKKKKH